MKHTLMSCILGLAAVLSLLFPSVAQAQTEAFPYPAVPETLRTPQARGAFLAEHYWDNFSFSDTTCIHKPELTELGFVNFIDLLPRVDSTAAVRGVAVFSAVAFRQDTPSNVRSYFADLAEHYLYDPNSPLRSDVLYMMFLERLSAASSFGPAERERFSFRLKNLAKNQVGTPAADFRFIDRRGQESTLYATKSDLTLLYFYDPDCENCHETTALFSQNRLLTDNPRLTVLAVYPDADTDFWRQHPQSFPSSWVDAYSPDGEVGAQLYFIRATPTILLLDMNKRVILKDPSPQGLLQYLSDTDTPATAFAR